VMLRQPVLGSFQPVTPALVTTGTRITPLTVLPSLPRDQQCFPSTSTTRICTYRRNNSLPATAQHFHTRLFRHPAHVCTVESVIQHFHNSHMNAACCMNQVTSEWVILNVKASCYLWMSNVTSETSCDL